jgi:hypothetical protein
MGGGGGIDNNWFVRAAKQGMDFFNPAAWLLKPKRQFESAKDIVSQGARGLGDVGYATAEGISRLVGAEGAAESVARAREQAHEFYGEADTPLGQVAGPVGRIGGELAAFATPGTAVGRVAGLVGRAGSLTGKAGAVASKLAKPSTRVGQFAREAAFGVPIDAPIGAANEDEALLGLLSNLYPDGQTPWGSFEELAESPYARAAFEAGVGVGLTGTVVAGLSRLGKMKATRYDQGALGRVGEATEPVRQEAMDIRGPEARGLRSEFGDLLEARRLNEKEAEVVDAFGAIKTQPPPKPAGLLTGPRDPYAIPPDRLEAGGPKLLPPGPELRGVNQLEFEPGPNRQATYNELFGGQGTADEAMEVLRSHARVQRKRELAQTFREGFDYTYIQPEPVGPPRELANPRRKPPGMKRMPRFRIRSTIPAEMTKKTEEEIVYQLTLNEMRIPMEMRAADMIGGRSWENDLVTYSVPSRPNYAMQRLGNAQSRAYDLQQELIRRKTPGPEIDRYQVESIERILANDDYNWNLSPISRDGKRIRRLSLFGNPGEWDEIPGYQGLTGQEVPPNMAQDVRLLEQTALAEPRPGVFPETPVAGLQRGEGGPGIPPDRALEAADERAGMQLYGGLPFQEFRNLTPQQIKASIGGGVGAALGAGADEENRLRGGVLGAIGGFGVGAGLGSKFLKNRIGAVGDVSEQLAREADRANSRKRVLSQASPMPTPEDVAGMSVREIQAKYPGYLQSLDVQSRRQSFPDVINQQGSTVYGLSSGLAGGAIGGAAGFALDDDEPLRGAIMAGTFGFVAGLAGGTHLVKHERVMERLMSTAKKGAPEYVSDITPQTGQGDFKVYIRNLRSDPLGVKELESYISKVKQDPTFRNQRMSTGDMEVAAKAVSEDEILKQNWNQSLSAPETFKIASMIDENMAFLDKTYAAFREATPQSADYMQLGEAIRVMEARQDVLLRRWIGGVSQNGRDLAAARLLANRTTNPSTWLMKAQRNIGMEQQLPQPLIQDILAAAKAGDKARLVELTEKARKGSTWKSANYHATWIRAGMLTLPVSLTRAIVGNSARAIADTASKPMAVLGDKIASILTHRRTQRFGGLGGAKARIQGIMATTPVTKEGRAVGKAILTGSMIDDTFEKFDMPRTTRLEPIAGEKSWMQGFVNAVFGSQGVLDRPFREMKRRASIVDQAHLLAFHGSLDEQAERIAKGMGDEGTAKGFRSDTQGLSREEFKQYLIDNPTADMAAIAAQDALDAVFQNKTALSNLATGLIHGARETTPALGDVVQATVLPFVRTPSSVASKGIESTPLGVLKTPHDAVRLYKLAHAKGKIDEVALATAQRRAVERFGRYSTGILGVAFGYSLYSKGLMTASLPQSPGERDQRQAEGKPPYSIYISDKVPLVGGRWHPVGQIQPFGSILAYGAALAEADANRSGAPSQAFEGADTWWEKSLNRVAGFMQAQMEVTGSVGQQMMDVPFFSGTKETIEVARDPERTLAKFLQSKAQSIVPNLVAGFARWQDPVVREADNVWQSVQSRLPTQSSKLAPKPDIFGEAIVREHGGADRALFAMANVTGSRRDNLKDDPVLQEIVDIGYVVPHIDKESGDTKEGYRKRQEVYGKLTRQTIEMVMNSREYHFMEQAAQQYINQDPMFANVTVADLAAALRRDLLRKHIARERRNLTTAIAEQGLTPFSQ